jgi:hypothetical protein
MQTTYFCGASPKIKHATDRPYALISQAFSLGSVSGDCVCLEIVCGVEIVESRAAPTVNFLLAKGLSHRSLRQRRR